MLLAFHPGLWLFVAQRHATALVTPVGFEMLDRVPEKRPVHPSGEDQEDPMAVQKTAA